MEGIPEVECPQEAEEVVIKLLAFAIMIILCDEGKITKKELKYLAKKRKIDILVKKSCRFYHDVII